MTPHLMPKIQKISPKFMLTQQSFNTNLFQISIQDPNCSFVQNNATIIMCQFNGVEILLSA